MLHHVANVLFQCSIELAINDLWIRARVQNAFRGVVISVKPFSRLHQSGDKRRLLWKTRSRPKSTRPRHHNVLKRRRTSSHDRHRPPGDAAVFELWCSAASLGLALGSAHGSVSSRYVWVQHSHSGSVFRSSLFISYIPVCVLVTAGLSCEAFKSC